MTESHQFDIIEIFSHALMVTAFVFMMMLLIEYINVMTRGQWQRKLVNHRWRQYFLGAFLGATPGCLGAFSVVSLYSHGVVSFGALVAAMIATSGDEAFVMFSMFPEKAIYITIGLLVLGFIAGVITDKIIKNPHKLLPTDKHDLEIHEQEYCDCFDPAEILKHLKNISFARFLMIAGLVVFMVFLISGQIGPGHWGWKRVTFLTGGLFSLFVVLTVPNHFLEKHLWEHLIKKHLLRIFLWTFGAFLLIHSLDHYLDATPWIADNLYLVLLLAVVIGIIPESGPHLIFVTLYFSGSIPLAILIASSIVQDGHGALPLLAFSKKSFIAMKAVNLVFGLIVGLILLQFG
jgi:hypothetical protein